MNATTHAMLLAGMDAMREATTDAVSSGQIERAKEYFAAGRLFVIALEAYQAGDLAVTEQACLEASTLAKLADLMMVS